MKQSKTIYLIFALILAIIILVVIQLFARNKSQPAPENKEVIQFNAAPKLKIIASNLSSEPLEVTDSFTIKFSQPVHELNVIFKIDPEAKVSTSFDKSNTELKIEPYNAWHYNQSYTITIFKSTSSEDNQALDKDYEFTFKTKQYIGI